MGPIQGLDVAPRRPAAPQLINQISDGPMLLPKVALSQTVLLA